jgi:hypothetical protein
LYPERLREELKPAFCLKRVHGANAALGALGAVMRRHHAIESFAMNPGARFIRRQLVGKNGNLYYIFSLGRIQRSPFGGVAMRLDKPADGTRKLSEENFSFESGVTR